MSVLTHFVQRRRRGLAGLLCALLLLLVGWGELHHARYEADGHGGACALCLWESELDAPPSAPAAPALSASVALPAPAPASAPRRADRAELPTRSGRAPPA
jgi:hypothetical protein